MTSGLLPSLLWGLLAFTFYGVAMVMMKYGADALSTPREILRDKAVRKKAGIWGTGALLNLAFAGALGVAVGLGHASVVSALNGFGLVVVAVLGRIFLGERLVRLQTVGMATVIAGVAAIGVFASPMTDAPLSWAGRDLGMFFGGLCLLSVVAVGASYAASWRHGAAVFGAAAGVLGGLAIILQKVAITPIMETQTDESVVIRLATSLLFWSWSATATGSFAVLQVAYRFGAANTIAPIMVATMIVVPLLGGPFVLGEVLTWGQMVGTGLVVLGAVLITFFEQPAAQDPAPKE